jgi:hypothetical protein
VLRKLTDDSAIGVFVTVPRATAENSDEFDELDDCCELEESVPKDRLFRSPLVGRRTNENVQQDPTAVLKGTVNGKNPLFAPASPESPVPIVKTLRTVQEGQHDFATTDYADPTDPMADFLDSLEQYVKDDAIAPTQPLEMLISDVKVVGSSKDKTAPVESKSVGTGSFAALREDWSMSHASALATDARLQDTPPSSTLALGDIIREDLLSEGNLGGCHKEDEEQMKEEGVQQDEQDGQVGLTGLDMFMDDLDGWMIGGSVKLV